MSSNSRAGDSRLVFGCTDETFGYVSAVEVADEPEKSKVPNGQGNTVAVEYFNKEKKVKGSYYFLSGVEGGPVDKVGDGTTVSLTDVGLAVHIEKASKPRQAGQWTIINFEGVYYPDLVNS